MTASFHMLSSSLLFINHPIIWRWIVWVTDNVVKQARKNNNDTNKGNKQYDKGTFFQMGSLLFWIPRRLLQVQIYYCEAIHMKGNNAQNQNLFSLAFR
jgi:hypothetical protein